jgi:hypothetical protein
MVAVGAKELGERMSEATPLLNRVTMGAFAANEPWPDLSAHYALERQLGVRLPVMSWFQSWTNGWLARQAADAASTGHDLQICLAPALDDGSGVPFANILAGQWNRRLDSYFTAAAAYPGQVTIRFCHEMNLSQHPWSIANRSPCTTDINTWLDTWRFVVDRQRAIGGNVRWQWCVNTIDMGGVSAESYWPGADYVDVLGIDVYNGYAPSWQSPLSLIKPMYDRITALHPSAPVWLAECGCRAAKAGETWNKAKWYTDLFAITDLPRLATIVFFNMDKEYDWRVSTPDVVNTVTSQLKINATQVAR